MMAFIMLEGVTLLRLDEVGALEVKIRLERTEHTGKFLLYAPTTEGHRRNTDKIAKT